MRTVESHRAASLAPVVDLDDLDRAHRHRWTLTLLGMLGASVVVAVVLGVSLGPVPISPVTVWRVIGAHLIS